MVTVEEEVVTVEEEVVTVEEEVVTVEEEVVTIPWGCRAVLGRSVSTVGRSRGGGVGGVGWRGRRVGGGCPEECYFLKIIKNMTFSAAKTF